MAEQQAQAVEVIESDDETMIVTPITDATALYQFSRSPLLTAMTAAAVLAPPVYGPRASRRYEKESAPHITPRRIEEARIAKAEAKRARKSSTPLVPPEGR